MIARSMTLTCLWCIQIGKGDVFNFTFRIGTFQESLMVIAIVDRTAIDHKAARIDTMHAPIRLYWSLGLGY